MHNHFDHPNTLPEPPSPLMVAIAADHILNAMAILGSHGDDDLTALAAACWHDLSTESVDNLAMMATLAERAVVAFRDELARQREVVA